MKIADVISFARNNLLTICTVLGVVLGVVLGIVLKAIRSDPWTEREAMYVKFIGELFLSILKSLIIPLIVPSLIATIGSMDLSLSGKIGLKAICFYMATTVIAVALGILLVLTIEPGSHGDQKANLKENLKENVTITDTLMDLARQCFPENLARSTMYQKKVSVIYPEILPINGTHMVDLNNKNMSVEVEELENYLDDKYSWKFDYKWSPNPNILGLVVWSIFLGIAISASGEQGKFLLVLFQSVSYVMMKVTTWVIYMSPVGVLFLVAGEVVLRQDMAQEFQKISLYFGTVMAGITIHGLIILPLIFTVVTKTLPFRFILNMVEALLTAWGTASTSATLPVTIRCLEQKNNINPIISRFVLPIGATINMDGTALYEAIAAIFIAQTQGMDLSFGQNVAIAITATAASIGAAGIPQAGMVTMVMVLDTVGLPSNSVGVILSIDWLLDRFRTTVNVLGDSIGAAIVSHYSQKELEILEKGREGLQVENLA